MKYLKIDKGKGYFWDGEKDQEIDKISKFDLLSLLNAVEADDFEIDSYDESKILNKAHQIIYENIHAKLVEFLSNKALFTKEVNKLYKDAIGKYSVELDANDD